MKTYLADQDVTLIVPLTIRGEPFIPDAGSVKWTLRDASGQVVDGFDAVAVDMAPASTEAAIVVPAPQNALGSGRFSKRTVVVTASKTMRPIQFQIAYRLCGWLNTTVTPQDVRDFIGVDDGELSDDAIDVTSAYFDVEDQATEELLSAALSAGDATERAANDAILAQAVLNVLPGLPLRLSQSQADGVFTSARPKIDLAMLEQRAGTLLADSLDTFAARFDTTQDILIAVALSPDPATGA